MTTSVRRPIWVVALLTMAVLVVVLLLASTVAAAPASLGGTSETFVVHRVEAGDTLWDIAAAHTGEGDDIRHMVFEIREVNGLSGSIISPGQDLMIPGR
jgi:LysM repeat protein